MVLIKHWQDYLRRIFFFWEVSVRKCGVSAECNIKWWIIMKWRWLSKQLTELHKQSVRPTSPLIPTHLYPFYPGLSGFFQVHISFGFFPKFILSREKCLVYEWWQLQIWNRFPNDFPRDRNSFLVERKSQFHNSVLFVKKKCLARGNFVSLSKPKYDIEMWKIILFFSPNFFLWEYQSFWYFRWCVSLGFTPQIHLCMWHLLTCWWLE